MQQWLAKMALNMRLWSNSQLLTPNRLGPFNNIEEGPKIIHFTELWKYLFSDYLASFFALHVHIVHVWHSYRPFRVPNVAFRDHFMLREYFRLISGLLSPTFRCWNPITMFAYHFPCHCIAYAIASVCVPVCTHFEALHFHPPASYVSVAEALSC